MKRKMKTNRLTLYALFVSLALIFSYIETLIPMPFFAPGMKLGLANIVIIVILYKMSVKDAYIISIIRILAVALLFGNAFSLAYSFAGGIVSLTVMTLLKQHSKLSITGVSIAGGITHNIAQIGVAAILLDTAELIYYLPVLLITGSVTGLLIGILGGLTLSKLKSVIF